MLVDTYNKHYYYCVRGRAVSHQRHQSGEEQNEWFLQQLTFYEPPPFPSNCINNSNTASAARLVVLHISQLCAFPFSDNRAFITLVRQDDKAIPLNENTSPRCSLLR